MQIQTSKTGDIATVRLSGRFQFDTHREFRAAYEPLLADKSASRIAVDLSAVDYLDSAALGMLLLLRDKLEQSSRSVDLVGAKGAVRQVLDIANFGRLFKIV